MLIVPVGIAVYDRTTARDDEDADEERKVLDLYPLYIAAFSMFARQVVIAIRYGSTSEGSWADLSEPEVDPNFFAERLLKKAWIIMPPEIAMREVELAMVKTGSTEKYFTFKPLTPIYPTMRDKLTDPEYWAKFKWTFEAQMKQEKMKSEACTFVLHQF